MRRSGWTVIVIIILVILVGGGYALFHNNKKPYSSNAGSTNTPAAPASKQSAAAPVNNSILTTKTDPTLGQYLADPAGMPLYTYNADTKGVSNCTGSCLANWPAYKVTASTNLPSGVGTITRADNGQVQYTYNGLPLYTFVSDSPGKVTGNGVENFSIATPNSGAGSSSSSSGTSSSSSSGYPY